MNTSNPYSSAQGTTDNDSPQDSTLSENPSSSNPTNPQMTSSPNLTNPMQNSNVITNTSPAEVNNPIQNDSLRNPIVEQQVNSQQYPVQNTYNEQTVNPTIESAPQDNTQDANSNTPINSSLNSPVISEPQQTTGPITEVPQKKGLPKFIKILIIVVLVFVLLATLSVAVFGAMYLKENHVPMVSGLTETVLLTEGEQFSSRMEYLFDLGMYKALTAKNTPFKPDFNPEEIKPIGADKIIEEVENAEQINYDTSLSLKYNLAQPLQPVLGIKDPGEITEDSISKILSSREGTISFSSQDSIQFNNQDRARNITNVEFEVPGVNLNTGFETRIIDKLIYINLDRFPRNDYVKVEEIEGKWLMIDPKSYIGDLGLEENSYQTNPTDPSNLFNSFYGMDKEELKKEDYNKMIQLINSSAVQNSITESFNEKVSETNARCFVMSLTQQNVYNIAKETAKLFDENYDESDFDDILESDYPFTKSDLTLCFAKMESYPIKLAFDFELEDNESTVAGVFEFKMTGMKMVSPIEKPNDATNFTIEDLEGLINQNSFSTPDSMLTDFDDEFVEIPSSEGDDDESNYLAEDFYNKSNVCEYLGIYKVCDLCTNDSPSCQTCLDSFNDELDNGYPMSEDMRSLCF